jgi:hypothetical protein
VFIYTIFFKCAYFRVAILFRDFQLPDLALDVQHFLVQKVQPANFLRRARGRQHQPPRFGRGAL